MFIFRVSMYAVLFEDYISCVIGECDVLSPLLRCLVGCFYITSWFILAADKDLHLMCFNLTRDLFVFGLAWIVCVCVCVCVLYSVLGWNVSCFRVYCSLTLHWLYNIGYSLISK